MPVGGGRSISIYRLAWSQSSAWRCLSTSPRDNRSSPSISQASCLSPLASAVRSLPIEGRHTARSLPNARSALAIGRGHLIQSRLACQYDRGPRGLGSLRCGGSCACSVRAKSRSSTSPLIHFPSFRYGLITVAIVALGEFGVIFVLSLYLQGVLGLTAFQVGLVFLPFTIATLIRPRAQMLSNRFGAKWVVTIGMLIEATAIFSLSRILELDTPIGLIIPVLILYGVGVGLAIAQLTSVVLSDVPPQRLGAGSGANNTIRQVGAAVGVAIIGAVLTTGIRTSGETISMPFSRSAVCQDRHHPADRSRRQRQRGTGQPGRRAGGGSKPPLPAKPLARSSSNPSWTAHAAWPWSPASSCCWARLLPADTEQQDARNARGCGGPLTNSPPQRQAKEEHHPWSRNRRTAGRLKVGRRRVADVRELAHCLGCQVVLLQCLRTKPTTTWSVTRACRLRCARPRKLRHVITSGRCSAR